MLEDSDNHLAGGLVVAINGKQRTNNEFRNRGLASYLHNSWYSSTGINDAIKYVAWIRDDNVASIRLHSRFGHIRQDTCKITMQKGIEKDGRKNFKCFSRG